MAIAVEPRDDLCARVGMWIFLGSTSILFGALVFAYAMLRARQMVWPPPGSPALPAGGVAASVAILACSSAALAKARVCRRSRALSHQLIGVAVLLALGFLATQVRLLGPLAIGVWRAVGGGGAGGGLVSGLLLTLLGAHAIHALAGAIVLAWLFIRAFRAPPGAFDATLFRVPEMFWHFLGVLWIVLLGALVAL